MLRLSLLGDPQISWRGASVEDLRALKSRALLCYLAMTGRPQPRPALASMLWGEKSDAQALVNLRQAIHQLHEALPGCCIASRASVALAADAAVEIDAVRFAQLARLGLAGDIAALRAAAEAYSGDFLAGVFLDGAPGFEEWLLHERESLRSLAHDCLRALLADAVQRREIGPGLQYARRLLALEPWLEEAHQQLMQLLAWDGQPGAALAQYERCRQILADELGVARSAVITALRGQILAGMGAAGPAPTGELVAPSGPPVHRTETLAPVAITRSPSGRTLVDFGPNLVGCVRFTVQGEAGQTIMGVFAGRPID